jgi:hypothetical protein
MCLNDCAYVGLPPCYIIYMLGLGRDSHTKDVFGKTNGSQNMVT